MLNNNNTIYIQRQRQQRKYWRPNPSDAEGFQNPEHKTFRGKCLIIIRSKANPGKITLKAEGESLTTGEVIIESKK